MTLKIEGISVPDSKLAPRSPNWCGIPNPRCCSIIPAASISRRVAGSQRGLKYDPELLYIGAMFHDMEMTPKFSSKNERFEVNGANTLEFLLGHGISSRISTPCGTRSPCTPLRASRSTCTRSSRCSPSASRWTSSG